MQRDREILRLLAACLFGALPGAAVAASPDASVVQVVLNEHSYAPNIIALHTGAPVQLVLVNRGVYDHDFSAPSFFETVQLQDASAFHHGKLLLHPGETKSLTLVPQRPGTYPIACTLNMHAMLGMTGRFEVQ